MYDDDEDGAFVILQGVVTEVSGTGSFWSLFAFATNNMHQQQQQRVQSDKKSNHATDA